MNGEQEEDTKKNNLEEKASDPLDVFAGIFPERDKAMTDGLDLNDVNLSLTGDDDEEISLFGELNTAELPAGLVTGSYLFKLDDFRIVHSDEKETDYVVFEWSVVDEDNPYFGFGFSQFYRIYPGLTQSYLESLTGKQRKEVLDHISWLRNQLTKFELPEGLINSFKLRAIKNAIINTEAYIEILVAEPGGFPKVRNFVLKSEVDENDNSDVGLRLS